MAFTHKGKKPNQLPKDRIPSHDHPVTPHKKGKTELEEKMAEVLSPIFSNIRSTYCNMKILESSKQTETAVSSKHVLLFWVPAYCFCYLGIKYGAREQIFSLISITYSVFTGTCYSSNVRLNNSYWKTTMCKTLSLKANLDKMTDKNHRTCPWGTYSLVGKGGWAWRSSATFRTTKSGMQRYGALKRERLTLIWDTRDCIWAEEDG